MNALVNTARAMVILIGLCFAPLSAIAEEYIIGVENIEYYPLYAKREGRYEGYARELLDSFAEQAGHSFVYKPLPIKRLFKSFVDSDVDFKFPDNPNWQASAKKDKKIVYSDSVIEYIDGVLVRPENLGKAKDSLKSLGVLRGFTPWDYLTEIKGKSIALKEVNSLKSLIEMTKAGRLDGVYFNVIVANYFQEKTLFEKGGIIFDSALPYTRSHYYLSSIKHPEIVDQFNVFLASNQKLVAKLKAKYEVNLF